MPPEEVLSHYSAKKRLEGIPTRERLEGISSRERLEGMPVPGMLDGLSKKQREALFSLLLAEKEKF